MNLLLWILQFLLAFWNVVGGAYTISNFDELKGGWGNDLPQALWIAIGALQVLFALTLILPSAVKARRKVTPLGAGYLALNALLGCAIFSQYAGFPGMLWGLIPAILAAFVAYGRYQLKPL